MAALQEKVLHASRSLATLRARGEAAKQAEATLKLEAGRREAEQREKSVVCDIIQLVTSCRITLCYSLVQEAASGASFLQRLAVALSSMIR